MLPGRYRIGSEELVHAMGPATEMAKFLTAYPTYQNHVTFNTGAS